MEYKMMDELKAMSPQALDMREAVAGLEIELIRAQRAIRAAKDAEPFLKDKVETLVKENHYLGQKCSDLQADVCRLNATIAEINSKIPFPPLNGVERDLVGETILRGLDEEGSSSGRLPGTSIQAIKNYRARTGRSLKDAKDVCDEFKAIFLECRKHIQDYLPGK